jgi:hypothetical protein
VSATPTNPIPHNRIAQQEFAQVVPYPPSFIDRLTDFVQRLPIPYALTYLILFTLESAMILIVAWLDGWVTPYQFSPIVFLYPIWLWGPLAFVTYLDDVARKSLAEFAPLLGAPTLSNERLEYEFTEMPARRVLISAVGWSAVYLFFWFAAFGPVFVTYRPGVLGTRVFFLVGFVSFAVGSVIYYHTFRQLRLVSRTVGLVKQFDLFALDPVYAFSVLTSHTGMAWVALITLTLLISPLAEGGWAELLTLVLQIALAMGAFLLPLRIVNRRLVLEKRGRLAELDQRVKATLLRLHQSVDDNSLPEVPLLNEALKGLTTEREILARIPTWPWRPGMFGSFVSIIVLPVVLFVIQFALGRWLGP